MVYRSLLRPMLFCLPSETAHHIALTSLSLLKPKLINQLVSRHYAETSFGTLERFGLSFSNPLGLAAGFDKDGVALQGLAALGFSFIEVGTVTLHPQPGNPRPRLFRLPLDSALINRAGFNNHGAAALAKTITNNRPKCVIGVSIGKSKVTPLEHATDDYLGSLELVYNVADYIAINVSSPNTEKLRQLQQASLLQRLLSALQERNLQLQLVHRKPRPLPLLVKISPDVSTEELEGIVEIVERLRIDGIIATNTTISRTHLVTNGQQVTSIGDGGLSGRPLRSVSTKIIAQLFKLTGGRVPIIGVGGISTANDAWEKITAGASLLQLYTGLIYEGPGIARDINRGVARMLAAKGLTHLDQAIGSRANELAQPMTS